MVLKIALEIEIYTNNNQISSAAAKIRGWKHPMDGLLPPKLRNQTANVSIKLFTVGFYKQPTFHWLHIGELIGFATRGKARSLCVLLQNLSYLQAARSLAGATSASPASPASPATPSRKRRYETVSLSSSAGPSTSTTKNLSLDEPFSSSVPAVGKIPHPYPIILH